MRKTNPVYFLQLCSTHLTLPWLILYALMSNYLQFIDKHFHFPSFVFFFSWLSARLNVFFFQCLSAICLASSLDCWSSTWITDRVWGWCYGIKVKLPLEIQHPLWKHGFKPWMFFHFCSQLPAYVYLGGSRWRLNYLRPCLLSTWKI